MEDQLFNFPIETLPRTCIYSLDFSPNMEFYDADKSCPCGHEEWLETIFIMKCEENSFPLPPQRINRCKKCNIIRLAKLKRIYEEVIDLSEVFLKSLLDIKKDKKYTIWIIKNVLEKIEEHYSKEIAKRIDYEKRKPTKKSSKGIQANTGWLNFKSDHLSLKLHEA